MSRMRTLFPFALLSVVLSGYGCGGDTPQPKAPVAENGSDNDHRDPAPLEVSAEIGALDADKVTKVFESSMRDLQGCLRAGAKRVEFIGGGVAFFIKVDQNGRVSHAHLERTSLGDRETERCMLDVLRGRDWPAPVGGKTGLARNSFDFDPPNDVRPAEQWSSDKVEETISSVGSQIAKCKQGAGGSYEVTMYVTTQGSPLSVGIAPPDERGEAASDCLVQVLKSASYPKPGSWPAKVSFSL